MLFFDDALLCRYPLTIATTTCIPRITAMLTPVSSAKLSDVGMFQSSSSFALTPAPLQLSCSVQCASSSTAAHNNFSQNPSAASTHFRVTFTVPKRVRETGSNSSEEEMVGPSSLTGCPRQKNWGNPATWRQKGREPCPPKTIRTC